MKSQIKKFKKNKNNNNLLNNYKYFKNKINDILIIECIQLHVPIATNFMLIKQKETIKKYYLETN